MDTKWNSTDRQALPGETTEVFHPYTGTDRKEQIKAVIAFLAFFLGVSLVLAALGTALGRWACQRDSRDALETNWQETAAFRDQVSAYLRKFLELGAGEDLDWYGQWYGTTERVVVFSDWGTTTTESTIAAETPLSEEEWQYLRNSPDAEYQDDKNVLYRILKDDHVLYQNTEDNQFLLMYANLPEGYRFLLTFENGKVKIIQNGKTLDVYGDGVYDEDSDWFVPGYDNFPAGDNVEGISVYMAVREKPVQYYSTDYGVQTSDMYWPYRSLQESHTFWLRQAVLLGAGILLLAVWFVLRKDRRMADQKLAAWTIHVWTELRLLAVAVPLCSLLLPRLVSVLNELWYQIRLDNLFSAYMLTYIGRSLAACLENTGALLVLFWVVWLLRNDHKYNIKSKRRSLLRRMCRALRTRDLQRPIQKRLHRRALAGPVSLAVLLTAIPLTSWICGWAFYWNPYAALISIIGAVFFLLMIWLVFSARKNMAVAKDMGLLADQVEAIRSGDLSTPLDLPADADLRQMSESLNDIQAGLNRALEEQTRSERMKVELISNVSHDLKTPLTSILSYAELLRQEPLEGAAADYARIIDEKAQRLKVMVQDVFEVSKAAADQLPVQPEKLDFAKLLRQTLADLEDPIRASGLTFRLDIPETPVEIVADGKRLYRVFQNLIGNALQYALPGSRVYLTLKAGEGRAEASLRNTSRDELPAGVDFTARFVRGDESRTDGGSGLGLSIAKSFTEACGGEFRVETVADLFTAVVTFPLADP